MSSHQEWVEEITAQHDAEKPFAPENGQPLKFKIGDPVIYTNEDIGTFRLRVTGFYTRPAGPCGRYATGSRYLLDWNCPWFPAEEAQLRLDESRVTVEPGTQTD